MREPIAGYREKGLLLTGFAQDTIDYRNRDYDQVITPHLGARAVQRNQRWR
ncbi:hypothetical protein [Cupriavidus basilensis]|uniref:hypothetical protein n=1 Tax=Cupriavidus basilensis TaxID=68895 RepID=UPI000AA3E470|nr:hypothetical protein [Cupriavidus basilensis]